MEKTIRLILLSLLIFFVSFKVNAASLSYHDLGRTTALTEVIKANYDHGCGIDYPCPPRPYYGKRRSRGSNGVYIHNNYGTVNIYTNGYRRQYRPRRYHRLPCDVYGCDEWRWRSRNRDRWDGSALVPRERVVDAEPTQCGGYSCDQNCGPKCWYGRFKVGYCGHGCDVYKQKVRFEEEDKTFKGPKIVYDTQTGVSEYDDVIPSDRDVRAADAPFDDRTDRRRFEGPKYPR